ncbi:transcription repressor OFP8-like [Miscanthus floridulus]|uniref:transcription repressor OFP8-like n=1 Tax=Miscanthus floridulus TaxID=154761 RepID=UPI00345A2683
MDCSSRSGGRRLKDRLTQLFLRPANTFLRSPCSSSSSNSTVFTATAAAAATTISISSTSSSTTAGSYTSAAPLSRAEPFSAALGRLRRPPPETESMRSNKEQRSTSSRHSGPRRFNNAVDKGSVRTLSSNPYGFTSSGEEDDGTDGYGDDDDTETFLSSRSLMSSDSSGFYAYRKLLQPPSKNKSHLCRQRRRRRCCRRPSASCVETCGAGAVREPRFRPLVAMETATATAAAVEQVRKGLAVVKRSRDPYGDFRESMVEMIMGRQVFGAAELERLLRSYLSLNAPRFHPVILQAFSDVWVVLHGG